MSEHIETTAGNAAAMREALETILRYVAPICRYAKPDGEQPTELFAIADTVRDIVAKALAAPPRNCDRFNSGDPTKDAADAYDEWQRYCDGSLMPPSCKVESAFRQWLFAPAKAETKGEADGIK